MATTLRRVDAELAAAATADLHNLPLGRVATVGDAAYVFTNNIDDLAAWHTARGGYTRRDEAYGLVTLWTLRTTTEPRADGSTTVVLVHAPVLDDEPVPDALTAVLPQNLL